ncbi:MAG: insulinase family protein [Acidobacteriaceae bacterium]|nr:insulinase family protein [Acidobacteriaceae bacterium]
MKSFIIATAVTLAWAGSSFSQSLKEFEKKVTEFTLSNGLHFIIVERHDAPVVAFNSYANVGAVDDPSGKTGLAHMFEHMAFKGTANIGSSNWPLEKAAMQKIENAYDELQNEQNKGVQADKAKIAQLQTRLREEIEAADKFVIPNLYTEIIEENGGEGLNAQTAMDSTQFFYEFPSNRLELWFLLESERFYAPVFREFYKERSVVREERRMSVESNPQGQLSEALSATAFEAHPYHNPPVGWSSDIESFRLADAIAFYKKYYVPSNLSIAIVGDVDPKEARRLADRYFAIIPAGPDPAPVHTVEPIQKGEREATVTSPAQPVELIGYKRPDERSEDDAVLDVVTEILSSGRTGLIFKELVRDKQVALDAGAVPSIPGTKYPNLFLLYLVPNQGKSLAECEKPLLSILERLKTQKIDDATLKRVKTKLRADLIERLDSNAGLASELNAYYWAYGDWRRLFTELDEYDRVTAEDVERVAGKYFIPEARTTVRLAQEK